MRGAIIDVGAGTGNNFAYFAADANVVALEPDASMARRAAAKLMHAGASIELRIADDRELESFTEGSIDAVVLTLVLCTVPDPATTLHRVKRVLKHDGLLVLIEHVRSAGRFGRFQDFIAPVWCRIADGCHLNRNTASIVAAAGFDIAALQTRMLPKFLPIRDIVYGGARTVW